MSLLDFATARIKAFLSEVHRLDECEFPYEHSQVALHKIRDLFESKLARLSSFDASSNLDVVKQECTLSLSALFAYTPLLGFILRSTNARNSFEVFGPLLRLSRELLEPGIPPANCTTRLVLSSEWDYSPFVYGQIADLPGFVLIGLPAPESSNPHWRTHPEEQQNALRGILAEVGYVDAQMVRELPDGSLQFVDGHLRAETTPDALVPVLVVDLDDKEADMVLATFDPLGAMAEPDEEQLAATLLKGIETNSEALAAMLEQLAHDAGCEPNGEIVEDEVPEPPDEAITKLGDLILLGATGFCAGTAASPTIWTACWAARRSIWSIPTRPTTSRSSPAPTTQSRRA